MALRLLLAYRGWPYTRSDEATLGLMADDIRWHGAFPLFFYGQHYLGAFQAYLAVPFFVVLGPTNAALHTTTTFEMALFLLILYIFTRQVYSPRVAGLTLVLLALGPEQQLFYGMRAGVHAQDTLLFSILVLWLTCLRLRGGWSRLQTIMLNLGIGLAAGLGLWGTFLTVPFIFAAGLALSGEAFRRLHKAAHRWRRFWSQCAPVAIGAGIGAAPLIVGTIASRGVFVGEILQANGATTGGGASTLSGLPAHLLALGQQAAGTFFISLPHLFGSGEVCIQCPIWPAPQSTASPAEALRAALISAPFSLLALACWLVSARPLVRSARRALHAYRMQSTVDKSQSKADVDAAQWGDARWWGRAILVIGAAVTVLEYIATSSSYQTADTSTRYLVGLYLCTPLLADPLWRGCRAILHWLQLHKQPGSATDFRPGLPSFLATGLLICVLALNTAGAGLALHETTDQQTYGVPAGQRDLQLLNFFHAQSITRFYTTYWVCNRLMFEAQEQIACAVAQNDNAFTLGVNREPAYIPLVGAAPHPAYVFDMTTSDKVQPGAIDQLDSRIAAGAPHFAGYTKIQIVGYLIYYYIGSH